MQQIIKQGSAFVRFSQNKLGYCCSQDSIKEGKSCFNVGRLCVHCSAFVKILTQIYYIFFNKYFNQKV